MKFIIGEKIDMTQIWQDEKRIAVTKVLAGPCKVLQVKTKEKDGYSAVQLGYGVKKIKNIAKPQKGHYKDFGSFHCSREFRLDKNKDSAPELSAGDVIDINTFAEGDKIQVIGRTKGRGFQGVVKRHGFHGQDKTHGNKDQLRMPGSIGACGPAHVFKGVRMPGHMGDDKMTQPNLKVVKIDEENNILYISGSIPGARKGLLFIQGHGELNLAKENNEVVVQDERDSSAEPVLNHDLGLGMTDEKVEMTDEIK